MSDGTCANADECNGLYTEVSPIGPNGVRGTRFFNGVPASCFPSSTGLGSSFDVELAHKVGEALADECRAKGAHVLLGT
jgi:beta-glucosidase